MYWMQLHLLLVRKKSKNWMKLYRNVHCCLFRMTLLNSASLEMPCFMGKDMTDGLINPSHLLSHPMAEWVTLHRDWFGVQFYTFQSLLILGLILKCSEMNMWTSCMRCDFYLTCWIIFGRLASTRNTHGKFEIKFLQFNNFTCVCLERMETRIMFTLYIHVC